MTLIPTRAELDRYARTFQLLSSQSALLIVQQILQYRNRTVPGIADVLQVSEVWVQERVKPLIAASIVVQDDETSELSVVTTCLPGRPLGAMFPRL